MTDSTRRIFLALWPDDRTRRRFHAIQQQLQQHAQLKSARPVAVENIHLTLHFLGSTAEPVIEQLVAELDAVTSAPFELVIDEVGCFPKAKVVWLGAREAPAELRALVRQTQACVNRYIEGYVPKPFAAHVTLFRKARTRETLVIEPVLWKVGSFALVESDTRPEGVVYRVLREWPLSS